jgi:hypothetical protein
MRDGKKSLPPPKQQRKEKPKWDPVRHELWFRGVLVKRFTRPAKNQWLLLATCEELGWPDQVPDPLPRSPIGPDHSIRLRQTVRNLNRHQTNPILRFVCDNTGRGVYWFAVEPRKRSYTDRTRRRG